MHNETYEIDDLVVPAREKIASSVVKRLPSLSAGVQTARWQLAYQAQQVPRVSLPSKDAQAWL